MNCDGARESMILALYDELPNEAAIELDQHLFVCTDCVLELDSVRSAISAFAYPQVEPDPNLLAASRMRLDAALDEISQGGFFASIHRNALCWIGHLRGAPALATLLLGAGFLSGNFASRYQATQQLLSTRGPVIISNVNGGGVSTVSGITHLPGEMVQVSYSRFVPEMVQGSLDDPLIRTLLKVGLTAADSKDVRVDSAKLLAGECSIGHECQIEALLSSLQGDRNPGVRLQVLDGLSRYVSQDKRVRDAMAKALLTDPSAAVRTRAIAMLEPVQGDTSVRQVLQTVSTRDDNPYIRTVSTQALVGIGSFQ